MREAGGGGKDYLKAASLYEKACNGHSAFGCYELGVLYNNGQGVIQDIKKAKQFVGKACKLGYRDACL